ncbi:MAG: hypothetical protein UV54_C0044G0011 [Candidatus Beckwithbacteria bacterium GW2011_GWA2_43_10]|uniref:SpoVT-AbrB domain-containing protein n=1 Tax=Candidatus Beckwithbacteria bacterium GW2011_GWA2_43_10 TaxID=1618369 RepID=A0A0G1C0B6_9BACT|nr:MAG: hypothetical protein UV54_C0044G0011 [Candidatus Beckwithbacteria bacterium GW2011_GWA2_43_10]
MQFITTVTQKGQVTLPLALRQAVNIDVYDKVMVSRDKKSIKITPQEDILDLAGTLKPRKNKNKTALQARKYMETHYSGV